ncbi:MULTISPECIES: hypothetical protein [unclassified Halomonas]|uniref:hypothetical protein n=1 Tax=unclassified Halomonas TaxID=2609666 RepID=UPI0006DB54E9|nr:MULTISPECIES: hypothetical protein [unclassified Halomonas]KPQ21211.1 MAG: hypothetical protein HLUCCO06_07970 [Halomonas sp. HL-93]SBR46842.1 hypothetical protein GA0071314_0921 [Halomonas sp. HL-93]SNY98941.1 hypothetical protein SAMN04488142_3574 [Halomonas sp. hl-4]
MNLLPNGTSQGGKDLNGKWSERVKSSHRLSSHTSTWAALLLSGLLLVGCGQEEEADGTAVPEESSQEQQDGEVAEEATQDDQYVSEQESASDEPGMEGDSTSDESAQEEEPLAGDTTEDPGFGDGTDPMPGDGEDASDLANSGNDDESQDAESDEDEEENSGE